jgi:hypothetical protein
VEENFSVRVIGLELMASGDELGAEFREIINLAIENDHEPLVGREHGLVTAG